MLSMVCHARFVSFSTDYKSCHLIGSTLQAANLSYAPSQAQVLNGDWCQGLEKGNKSVTLDMWRCIKLYFWSASQWTLSSILYSQSHCRSNILSILSDIRKCWINSLRYLFAQRLINSLDRLILQHDFNCLHWCL